MRLVLDAEISPIKAGFAARSAALRLSGHGATKAEALHDLGRGVRALAVGMKLADGNLDAMAWAIVIEEDGEDRISVSVREVRQ